MEIYTNEKQQPVLGHTMNLERGLSGSPLIYRENDKYFLIGLHQGIHPGTYKGEKKGIFTGYFLNSTTVARIKKILEQHDHY